MKKTIKELLKIILSAGIAVGAYYGTRHIIGSTYSTPLFIYVMYAMFGLMNYCLFTLNNK